MAYEMVVLLINGLKCGASDLTISPGVPPFVGIGNRLEFMGEQAVSPAECQRLFKSVASIKDQAVLEAESAAQFSFQLEDRAFCHMSVIQSVDADAPTMRVWLEKKGSD